MFQMFICWVKRNITVEFTVLYHGSIRATSRPKYFIKYSQAISARNLVQSTT